MDLTRLGEETAAGLHPEGRKGGAAEARTIRRAMRALEAAYRRTAAENAGQTEPAPAAEWLLDNWYLAQREGREAERSLRRATRRLRTVRGGGELYVVALAQALAGAGDALGPESLGRFLAGVQRTGPLSELELAHFVPALKGALVRRLAGLCRRLDRADQSLAGELEQIFTGLRVLSGADLSRVLEDHSLVEQTLRRDPSGAYGAMDDATRARYRDRLCTLARKHGLSEPAAAERVLELCARGEGPQRHVGWYLFRCPLGGPCRTPTGRWYSAAVILPTLCAVLLLGVRLHSWAVTLLLLLPVSDIVKNTLDFLIVRLVRPRPVCRMALDKGIPPEGKTLCVIAGLLTGPESGEAYAALLERYRLANRDAGDCLSFGLLADLPDRERPMGGEQERWVRGARAAIDALNETYGGGFYLFFREPVFQLPDERWLGWERKRGALLELCRLLKGRPTGLYVAAGARRALNGVRFVITLDSDTSLNVGTARELVGAMLHPLNRAVVDAHRRVVVSGYGLLQPRVGVELNAANRSPFARIFAGQGGVDPYGSTSSDVYHDLFNQGTYTGKGIFDVDAFYACLEGRFPQNRVLSHDLLEGSYLHAGLIGDVELTDGYPYKVTSYFARLHRWVRGDWQLLPWLGRRVPTQSGVRERNPLLPIARWKLFDNLRRSLSPVCTLLALLLGMCSSRADFAAAATAAVIAAASNLLLSGAELVWRRGRGLRERYHSPIIAGFGGVLLQTLVQLLFLPLHAWTCASAIATALWRQAVTHRGLLDWVTAADTDQRTGDGLRASYGKGWPAVAAGVAAILFSRYPAGGAAGMVWVLSPLFAWAMSRPIPKQPGTPASLRPFLLQQGALIWRYFDRWLRPEDHWLPPDNVQSAPDLGPARRTSPTNIGLALMSCLAAADLELCARPRAVALIGHMLDTLEALPKWQGHLYNWYDTASAQPLSPRYVSTVDGGNLCGCLIALREGLYEWGEDALARRAEALSDAMDFSLLYDRQRRLFYIGYEVERQVYTQGWYDLMASEARQTSYLAVARGQVSPRHWRRLSRTLVGDGDYRGMVSWTGTMFEYFMPNLLLPVEPNSLMYESLAFCLREQRKRGARAGVPWGVSESCFYAFDGGLSYQYKAHGVQKLGLKRDLDRELVVAPYASFLALLLAPGRAGHNLRRLRDLGAEGEYGLYEALDFTPGRSTGAAPFALVRTFMSHHLGMSLVAIDNALNAGVMQERFLRDRAMGAYRELLQERIPVGAAVLRNPEREVPEGPSRPRPGDRFVRECAWTGAGRPACHLVSNGNYTVCCSADGWSRSHAGPVALTTEMGLRLWFYSERAGACPLVPDRARFDGGAAWTGRAVEALSFTHRLSVPEQEHGEARELTLRWQGDAPLRGELVCYLEPVLTRMEDYLAHPAFSKLFLESSCTGDGVVFTRRPRRPEDRFPAFAVVWDRETAFFDTSREVALGRGSLNALDLALKGPAHSSAGAVLDPCLLLRLPAVLAPGDTFRLRMGCAIGATAEEAVSAARRLLHSGSQRESRALDRRIVSCHLTGKEALQAFELLAVLRDPAPKRDMDQRTLWPFGISGDLPLAVLPLQGGEVEHGLSWLGGHKLLTQSGFSFDLAIVLDEGGDYRRLGYSRLREALKALGWDHMLGAKGGVHLLGPAEPVLEQATVRLDQPWPPCHWVPISNKGNHFILEWGVPLWESGPDGAFRFHCGPRLPPVGWSQMLTNGSMGWMVDETGCGHLWRGNAREQALTPWNNDPLAIGGPEWFTLQAEEGECSLFAAGDGLPCTVTYGPGFARWEKSWYGRRITTTAFVPLGQDVRVLLLTLDGSPCVLTHRWGETSVRYEWKRELALITGPSLSESVGVFSEARRELGRTVMYWNHTVSALKVHTPDPALDRYLNGWALYQVIACRLMGRTSRYQNGGAYGFRDQLQDVCATLLTTGTFAREQLLRSCAHQFREGDVQHWWHEPEGKGVRTRISDDLLWLPYALCAYLEQRGDWTILKETVPYLTSAPLAAEERERYEQPAVSHEAESVYLHGVRAVELVLDRGTGPHGLARIGTGDWNDGMDRVGPKGHGESVWLTWFTIYVLEHFAPVCEHMGEPERAQRYREAAGRWTQAAREAWDGGWYLRGWYDGGAPLGSHICEDCQIDSIAQSWSALVQNIDKEKACTAVEAALERLFDRPAGLVKLFAPPFDGDGQDPGYIRGYVPGVRENGGQYTHAALWLALACFRLGKNQEGRDILSALLPERHDASVYQAEPYVLAGDVYANPAHVGRGGWSWYTGAAGWYYRVAMEELLGLRLRAGRLFLEPGLPEDWPGYTAVWRMERATLRIQVRRGAEKKTLLDGRPVREGVDLAQLEGEHRLETIV